MNMPLILKLTALTYVGLLAAGLLMPGVVGLRKHIGTLPQFIRQRFWVDYVFLGLSLVSFGLGTFFLADQLASGTPLARAVCGFLAVFWTVRLVAGAFLFDLATLPHQRLAPGGIAGGQPGLRLLAACLRLGRSSDSTPAFSFCDFGTAIFTLPREGNPRTHPIAHGPLDCP
jgi:hypothetical protein